MPEQRETTVSLSAGTVELPAELGVPESARKLVIFSHPWSGLDSDSDRRIAAGLRERGLSTLRFDMVTEVEAAVHEHKTDWQLLASRLIEVSTWARTHEATAGLEIGYFGSSAGAAPPLIAAMHLDHVDEVVTRGGLVDLAPRGLDRIENLLMIVGTEDEPFRSINERANDRLGERADLCLIEDAGHSNFSDRQVDAICDRTANWFEEQ